MTDIAAQKWNHKYSQKEFAYGTQPNTFFKEQIDRLQAGKILLGAEGEGRNGVYAAQKKWEVMAFDISIEAKKKALQLAGNKGVTIDYQLGNLPDLKLENDEFDAIALIFAHFSPNIRAEYHKLLHQKLKHSGIVIFEGFSKKHSKYQKINPKIGGPSDADWLFSIEEIKSDFGNYEIIQLTEEEVELSEGNSHNGKGFVIRFLGIKR